MSKKDDPFSIHHPDDNLFGEVLRETSSARAYLEHFYPDIAQKVDLSTLTLESESFLTPPFELFKADIIYRCKWKDSKDSLYFSLLWEHKLQPETYVAVQIGLYIFLAMHKMVKEKGRALEPVLPLLFYNGKRDWQPKTIHDLFEKKAYFSFFKPYLPNFDFLFKNIATIPTEKILEIEVAFFRSALLAMANRHDDNLIFQHLSVIFELDNDYQFDLLATYIVGTLEQPPEKLRQMAQHLKNKNKGKFMSTLEMLLKEGEDIGLIKGEEIGLEKGREIGLKKGTALKGLMTLLKILEKFPTWKVEEFVQITEIKKESIIALQVVLATKKKRAIQKVIKEQLLFNIQLSKVEQAKINQLVEVLLKKK